MHRFPYELQFFDLGLLLRKSLRCQPSGHHCQTGKCGARCLTVCWRSLGQAQRYSLASTAWSLNLQQNSLYVQEREDPRAWGCYSPSLQSLVGLSPSRGCHRALRKEREEGQVIPPASFATQPFSACVLLWLRAGHCCMWTLRGCGLQVHRTDRRRETFHLLPSECGTELGPHLISKVRTVS